MGRVVVIFLCIALLKLTCFALNMSSVDFSTYRYIADGLHTFTTVSVSSLTDCWTLCDDVTSCVAINYRSRGHICELVHNLGWSSILSTRKAGYVSRVHNRTHNVYVTDGIGNTQCPDCGNHISCIVEDGTTGMCQTFACRNPPKYGTMEILGNMNTFGGKRVLGCYDHVTEKKYAQYIQCSNGGEWVGLDPICGYGDYRLNTNTPPVQLKIVNKKVNKSEAERRCGHEGAKLTTLLTLEKLELFRSIAGQLPGDFWIDAVRINGEDKNWQTSNATQYDVGNGLWVSGKWKLDVSNPDNCARSVEKGNWKINDAQCYKKFSYICEMP